MTEELKPKQERRLPGWLSALLYFGVVALIAVGILWVYPDDVAEIAVGETSTTTTSTTAPEEVDVTAPQVEGDTVIEEPVAETAEVILPSVVHIQVSGGGVGSGVVYGDGLVMTAAHVVQDSESVGVRFSDGEQVTGEVLGTAGDIDIAVIEVDREGLTPATFATEKPRVGQTAIAVGSPWGLEATVTAGIVSAVDQTNCSLNTCASMVQTDAAINPGNSGGPLVDREGRVIGINVSIVTSTRSNAGVGFAVPADIATTYADAIVSGEPIETAFLGVQADDVETDGTAGAEITTLVEGSAAEESGLEVGDVIIGFDGVPIVAFLDLVAQVRAHQPGETVDILILRDGEEMTITATLGVDTRDVS
ncbi:MAG: S1C family serine protease [Actinomycetota bacterium]